MISRKRSGAAPVSQYGRLTFAVPCGFLEYIDEISRAGCVRAVLCCASGESGPALGRWWLRQRVHCALYSSGELTSAFEHPTNRTPSSSLHKESMHKFNTAPKPLAGLNDSPFISDLIGFDSWVRNKTGEDS